MCRCASPAPSGVAAAAPPRHSAALRAPRGTEGARPEVEARRAEGLGGSTSEMTRRSSSKPAAASCCASNGGWPVSSS